MRIPDNSESRLSGDSYDDLKPIADLSLNEAIQKNPNLLVFPPEMDRLWDDMGSNHICSLSGDKDSFSIKTNNLMGFVGYGSTELSIYSRFDSDSKDYFLHYMLQKVFCPNLIEWRHSYNNTTIFDFLLYLFPYYLNKALSQGLYKEYCRFKYNNSRVKGAIEVSRHINRNFPFAGNIAYSTREYSFDNRITQLIRHTIEYIKTTRFGNTVLRDMTTQSNVRLIIDNTPTYSKQQLRRVLSDNAKEVRHPFYTEYTILQRICLQILRHDGFKYGEDDKQVYGILFRGDWLWEEYIAVVLKGSFAHYTAANSHFKLLNNNGVKKQKIIPDYISIDKRLVADAKYIPLEKNSSYNEERATYIYYKTIMYMLRFSSKHGLLFYPNSEIMEPKTYDIINTDCKLSEVPLHIVKPNDDIDFITYCDKLKAQEELFIQQIDKLNS
ncbi:MAG: restriction endonuclease [Bacteroidales bacterium]|nr:restriction endonuclease [Bacteroidales bacterium]MCF0190364.1 restriction endonuclease [Marinilabiliaceae bacterium]